jgi:protein SCO1
LLRSQSNLGLIYAIMIALVVSLLAGGYLIGSARDTPDVLASYLGRYDAEFIGITGDESTLWQMGAEYGLLFQQETLDSDHNHEYEHHHGHGLDNENYFVQHTSPSFLIDRDGYVRMVYFYGTEPEIIAEGIRQMTTD